MDIFQLPPELEQLERELAARTTIQPEPGLRQRVLALQTFSLASRFASMSTTEFIIATAAAVLLCANLSLSLSNQTDFGLHRQPDTMHLASAAQKFAGILPDLPHQEAFLNVLPRQLGAFPNDLQTAPLLRTPGRISVLAEQRSEF